MSAADDGSKDRIAEFTDFRKRMNERILGEPNQVVRRFFALDTQTYQAGALDVKTKELLGLVASMVLRCDDCISYHVAQCKDAGVTREEFFETFSVGLVVGGSIVIPHLRRAVDFLDQLEGGAAAPAVHRAQAGRLAARAGPVRRRRTRSPGCTARRSIGSRWRTTSCCSPGSSRSRRCA